MKKDNYGFKSAGICPITNRSTVNVALTFKDFHISYNSSVADYGSDTTAIVLKGRVFLILNGDHRQALSEIAQKKGVKGGVEYFINNIAQANDKSEHRMIIGECSDPFGLTLTALDIIGQNGIDRISRAVQPQENIAKARKIGNERTWKRAQND